jgi:hypothetical protein
MNDMKKISTDYLDVFHFQPKRKLLSARDFPKNDGNYPLLFPVENTIYKRLL